jgi:hypothetical protein
LSTNNQQKLQPPLALKIFGAGFVAVCIIFGADSFAHRRHTRLPFNDFIFLCLMALAILQYVGIYRRVRWASLLIGYLCGITSLVSICLLLWGATALLSKTAHIAYDWNELIIYGFVLVLIQWTFWDGYQLNLQWTKTLDEAKISAPSLLQVNLQELFLLTFIVSVFLWFVQFIQYSISV